jgi:hypothetical protein
LVATEAPCIDVSIVAAVHDAASFRSVAQPPVIAARDLQVRGMRIKKIAGAIPGNDPGIAYATRQPSTGVPVSVSVLTALTR